MAHYDFREFLCALEQKGLLLHVTCEVDRIGELSQVMRWVYRGFPEEERFAVIFDNVKGFDIPVVVGAIGGSYKTYATGLGLDTSLSKPEVMQGIKRKWIEAMDHQILPIEVANPPCQEIVLRGNDINIHRLPIPVWTLEKDKGWDKGYGFMTSPYVITRDPETRIQNMGTYRGMTMAAPDEITIGTPPYQHIGIHWSKYNSKNERMPIAVAIAAHPAVGMASVTKIPYGMDELSVAGGLRGEPIEVTRCLTNDLLVPATAEIIIEGETLPQSEREYVYEAPFGEYLGYQGSGTLNPITKINAITMRKGAIYQGFISQMPPSESSKVRHLGHEPLLLRELKAIGLTDILDIHQPECGQTGVTLVRIRKRGIAHPKKIANAIFAILGKIVIVLDEDCDIYDWDDVMWNVVTKLKLTPQERHVYFIPCGAQGLDYTVSNSLKEFKQKQDWPAEGMFIDATKPFIPYPVTSLPKAALLEKTRDEWEKYGLPPLKNSTIPPNIAMEEDLLRRGIVEKPEIL